MMTPKPESMQVPYEVYQDLVNHLEVHAATDTWAESCLRSLQKRSLAVHDIRGWERLVNPIAGSNN